MENIYCISGLGADERVFSKLRINNAKLIYIPWLPFDKHDELPCYAQKMASQIPDKNPTILGLSFGGMVATEIAKQRNIKRAFLVSSAKGKHELPDISVTIRYFVQHHLMPYSLFKKPNKILYNRFGAKTDEEKALLAAVMGDTDTSFLGWAFKAILDWQNTTVPPNIIHIHGTSDRVIQPSHVQANYWLKDGTHMMIYNRAAEVGSLITGHIASE